jgi:MFS family permease
MNLQRTLLRAMLWMLGLSAGAGVLAVFLSTRVMGRVAGTALVAALAVGLAMPVSKWMDDEKKRLGGVVGLGAIVVAFALAMGAIWVDLINSAWDTDLRLAGTSILVCVGGLVAANMVAGRVAGRHWWARTVGLYADVLGAGILAGALWSNSPLDEELGESGWLVLASGLVAALALVGFGVESRPWRWLGVLASGVGLVLGLLGVWVVPSDDPTTYVAAMCAGAVVAYANIVLSVPLGEARGWACLVSIGSVAATAACVSLLCFITGGFDQGGPDMLVRLTGAMGIVAACSTLGVVILYRLNRRPQGMSAAVSEIGAVQLVCPHCGRKQGVPVGESACVGCGLVFSLKVSEPRCVKCEYPLLDLRGEVCPECGTAIGRGETIKR